MIDIYLFSLFILLKNLKCFFELLNCIGHVVEVKLTHCILCTLFGFGDRFVVGGVTLNGAS